MRKIFLLIVLGMVLLCLPAFALTPEEALEKVMSSLTEVYGYEQEEADHFTAQVEEQDGRVFIRYAHQDHPEWVYTAEYDPMLERIIDTETPFRADSNYVYYPGESAVRYGLTHAREEKWFANWKNGGQDAMMDYMMQWGVQRSGTMMEAAATRTLTPGNALHEFFVSAYGDPASWPKALTEWHNAEMNAFGLKVEDVPAADDPIVTYEVQPTYGKAVNVTRFDGEIPEDIQPAMQEALDKGWKALAGTYRLEGNGYGAGLAVLEKDGVRRLAKLSCSEVSPQWSLHAISDQAVPEGRVQLKADPQTWDFLLICTKPNGQTICMELRTALYDREEVNINCNLQRYERWDVLQKNGIVVEVSAGHKLEAAAYGNGSIFERFSSANPPVNDLSRVGLADFPTTIEACKASGIQVPEGYGVSMGVHLRKKTSSRSKDLGLYKAGTLVKILGMEPGDPFDWVHVQIGSAEGYMSSNYVFFDGGMWNDNPLAVTSLPLAETVGETALKASASVFSKTREKLPPSTRMHVLAENGNWLHVMLTGDELGSMMNPDGTDGYVKADQVKIVKLNAELEW